MVRLKEEGIFFGKLLESVSFGEVQKLKEIAIRNKIMGLRNPLDDYYAFIGSSSTRLREGVFNRIVKFYENAKIDKDFMRYHLTETINSDYISNKFIIPEIKTEVKYTGTLPNAEKIIKPVENVLSSYGSGEFIIDGGIKAKSGEIFADAVVDDIDPYVQRSLVNNRAKDNFNLTIADKIAKAVNASIKTGKTIDSLSGRNDRVSDVYRNYLR